MSQTPKSEAEGAHVLVSTGAGIAAGTAVGILGAPFGLIFLSFLAVFFAVGTGIIGDKNQQ